MTDPRNFLLNTDYPLDKIVLVKTGSISVPNGTWEISGVSISHGLPFTPLTVMLWSNTSNFDICNEGGDAAYMNTSFSSSAGQKYTALSKSSTIEITRLNYSGSTKTVYYRIFCFAPSNASIDSIVSATDSVGNNFIINTDYNYMKLHASGILTAGGTVSYTHGLGYTPRVQLWTENDGTIERDVQAQIAESDPNGTLSISTGVHVTTTALTWMNPVTYQKIHYRIYADA